MILYLDTSAFVKQYFREIGSDAVTEAIAKAGWVGSSAICRVEMEAAFAKYVRMRLVSRASAQRRAREFREDWKGVFVIDLTQEIVELASELVWEHNLRGYDAVHLASALTWQRLMREPITFAAFDRRLLNAAKLAGLSVFPEEID